MTRLSKAQQLADRLRHDPTPVTTLEIGEAAAAIYYLLDLLEELQEERDNG